MKIKYFALISLLASFSFTALAQDIRIISGASTVTEALIALGAKDKIIAIDLSSQALLKDKNVPMLGYNRQLPIEGMLALKPTHLIGSADMGPDSSLTIMKSAGVQVQAFATTNALDDFDTRIDRLAALTGTQDKAEEIKADVERKIQAIRAKKPNEPVNVMFIMLSKGRPITVAGQGTTVNTIIELAGGTNPIAKQFTSFKQISSESLLQMQPKIILIAERLLKNLGGMDALIKEQPLLAATPAFKNKQIIAIPSTGIQGGYGLASLALTEDLHKKILAAADKS